MNNPSNEGKLSLKTIISYAMSYGSGYHTSHMKGG